MDCGRPLVTPWDRWDLPGIEDNSVMLDFARNMEESPRLVVLELH